MSAIYFHSREETVAVRGAERAHFGVFCSDLTWSVIRPIAERRGAPLRRAFPAGHYVLGEFGFAEAARLFISMPPSGESLLLDDAEVEPFAMSLNTAFRLGSDPVKLGARLHGQCEIHAYVEGKNRGWLADIIEEGRAIEFYRPEMGWEGVIDLLRADNAHPVVTSYSVTESFPNQFAADWGASDDDWYALPDDRQWDLAVGGLRESDAGLEMTPMHWNDFYFDAGIDANLLVRRLLDREEE